MEKSGVSCHCILGSDGLFTNMICFHPPESGTMEKVPPETRRCLRSTVVSMIFLHGLAKLPPSPMHKAASLCSPHSRREGEPLKKPGCLSHFSVTPDVM